MEDSVEASIKVCASSCYCWTAGTNSKAW